MSNGDELLERISPVNEVFPTEDFSADPVVQFIVDCTGLR